MGLHVYVETYAGCGKQVTARAKQICEGIAERREWSFNPHSFTPAYEMPFINYRDFWCDLKIAPEDVITLKSMNGHSEKSITRSLEWLVKLLEAETTGFANEFQKGSIFDPRMDNYLLKTKCSL